MTIKCQICGVELKCITHAHLKKHGISPSFYKQKYGETYSTETLEKISKSQSICKKGDNNPARRPEVIEKIKNSVKKRWEEGKYAERVNGMLGKFGDTHHNYKEEIHTPLFLAEKEYVDFLSNFQDVRTCIRCGNDKDKMNVHHIDENHKNFLPSNLEPLCVPCHVEFHYKARKQPFIYIGKQFVIDAAHFLPDYNGLCKNLHGHQWKIEVKIKKRVDRKTGMVMDFKDLKNVVKENIINLLDHHCINDLIINPTAENLLIWSWEKLMFDGLLKGIYSITIWETPESSATIDVNGMLSVFSSNIEEYVKKFTLKDKI